MSGGESQKRTEEEREASLLRREIREKEFLEEQFAFFELNLWDHEPDPFLSRAEEEREDPPAKRPEIRKMELMEEHMALNLDFLDNSVYDSDHEPGPHLPPSSSTIPFTMGGAESKKWRQRPLDYLRTPHFRSESWTPMRGDQSMGSILSVKRPYLPSRQIVSPLEPGPNISSSLDFSPLKEEAVSPAPSCVSMKSDRSMGLPVSFKRYKFSLEEERAVSPASSCVSMKSARSMDPPLSFKRPASCESVKSDQSMGPPLSFKREDFWSHERGPFIFCGQKAGSPAPSCLSMKSDMSRESPPYFSNEPLPSDTKYPVINAGLWRELNSMVSHVQNELDKLKRLVRAINPEGQGEYEEGVKCEGESAEKRQQRGISEDHTGLPEKN